MARGGARTDVELVEDDDDGVPGATGSRAWRTGRGAGRHDAAHGTRAPDEENPTDQEAADGRAAGRDAVGRDAVGRDAVEQEAAAQESALQDTAEQHAAEQHAADDPDGSHRTRRRAVLVGTVVVAVLVVVGLVGQTVVSSRERARLAALADVPGIVDLVDGPVRTAWSTDDLGVLDPAARTPDGGVVVVHEDEDGAASVAALDPDDGTVVWRTELIGAGSALPVPPTQEPLPSTDVCLPSPTDSDLLVCRADNAVSYGDGSLHTQLAPTTARLVVLDARDGSVVRDLTDRAGLWGSASVAVLGDLVVQAGVMDTTVHLRATSTDGTPAWETTLPTTVTTGFGTQVLVTTTTDELVVVTQDTVRLLDASGRTLQEAPLSGTTFYRGTAGTAAVLESVDQDGTVLVDADGTRTLPGWWSGLLVDDGSVPGLVLTSGGGGLRAWTSDGEALWANELHGTMRSAMIVLDGHLFLGNGASVVALDVTTGAEVWRVRDVLPESGLATDGRHVFVLAARPARSAPHDVVGIDAVGGEVLWREPLPRTSDMLLGRRGVLTSVAFGADGVSVAVLR